MEVTLVGLKKEIADSAEKLRLINENIKTRKKELGALDSEISNKRSHVQHFDEVAADIIKDRKQSVHKAIAQRNSVDKQIHQLEKARKAVEFQIAEQKKEADKIPNLQFVSQIIENARETLKDLDNNVSAKEAQAKRLDEAVVELQSTKDQVAKEKEATDTYVKTLQEEARQIEEKRNQHLKALAQETAKAKAIRAKERDIAVMHARLEKAYGKTRNRPQRRSTM